MNQYIKKKCVNGETVSCNTESNSKLYCCETPGHEIQKARHYTNMSRNYYTRLEDRIKAKLKNRSCNDRMKVIKSYAFDNKSELQSAVNLWINSNDVAFCKYGHISNWNTSEITNMSGLFQNAGEFNDDISNWNTSNVTSMASMFQNASNFNQDISNWNVGKVTTFLNMFNNASSFDQNIFIWNVGENGQSNILFGTMFDGATQMDNNYSAAPTPSIDDFNK